MTTKSASNRYFKTRYSKKGNKKARVNYSWAKDFNKRILKKHFERHGEQMKAHTKEVYAAHAVSFANYIDKKI